MISTDGAPAIVEYGPSFRSRLGGIVVGADGSIWAEECDGTAHLSLDGKIVEIRRHDAGSAYCGPFYSGGIGAGPANAIWTNGGDRLLEFRGNSVREMPLSLRTAYEYDYSVGIEAFAVTADRVYVSRSRRRGLTFIASDGSQTFVPVFAYVARIAAGASGA